MGHPRTILIPKIIAVVRAIASVDPRGLQSGQVGKEVGEAVLAQCGLCLTAVASALDAGLEPNESIPVTLCGHDSSQAMTLADVEPWCLERAACANEGLYRVRIQQALLQASVWVGDLDAPGGLSEDQAILAAETGRYLVEVLRDARSAGLSDRMQLNWNATTITLAAATKLGDYVATTGSRRIQFLEAERAAQDLP